MSFWWCELISSSQLISCWEQYMFEFSHLETILLNHLPALCYSLSLILRRLAWSFVMQVCATISPYECVSIHSVQSDTAFSFEFHLHVAREVIKLMYSGAQMPEDVLSAPKMEQAESEVVTKLILETSVGDSRLWAEVLRNLSKDLSKQSAVQISESTLTAIEGHRSRTPLKSASNTTQRTDDMITFSCGHAFLFTQFCSKVLMDFTERVQDFPIPIPLTVRHLQMHFKQSSFLPSACPYCVFQYLRKLQLQECPGVPIRPWNP